MTDYIDNIKTILDNIDKIPDELWVRRERVNQPLDQKQFIILHEYNEGGYDWESERLELTKDGELRYAFDSGCSCNGPWENLSDKEYEYKKCENTTKKSLVVTLDEITKVFKERYDKSYDDEKPPYPWNESNTINDLVTLLGKPDVSKVFGIRNTEIRRCYVKNIGYEKIKKVFDVKVIDSTTDNNGKPMELFDIEIKEEIDKNPIITIDRYLMVVDGSSKRQYLLGVPNNIKTCHFAKAWTFDIHPDDFNPIIET